METILSPVLSSLGFLVSNCFPFKKIFHPAWEKVWKNRFSMNAYLHCNRWNDTSVKRERMLNQISWYNYILYSFSVIGIYYSYILLVYYRQDLSNLIRRRKPTQQNSENGPRKKGELKKGKNVNNSPEALEQLFTQAMILSEEIKSVFQEISFQEGSKEELLVMLRKKIAAYPSLRATPFRVAIQNLIQTEASKYQMDLAEDQKEITAL